MQICSYYAPLLSPENHGKMLILLSFFFVFTQERIAKSHGSQCGFCTPGIVMSMYTLLRNNPQPTSAEMENAFEGSYFTVLV